MLQDLLSSRKLVPKHRTDWVSGLVCKRPTPDNGFRHIISSLPIVIGFESRWDLSDLARNKNCLISVGFI
jgi:hypothetical protein